MRESIPIPEDIYDPAVALVQAIGLEGVCEVEFRRDAGGRPLLMEINARLAGTIENAVHSGVDFPMMIWRWATGQQVGGGGLPDRRPDPLAARRHALAARQLRAGRPSRQRVPEPGTVDLRRRSSSGPGTLTASTGAT